MAEAVGEIASSVLESKKIENDPPFLNKLRIDHPKIADEIKGRIPDWKMKVDELSGIENFGTKILEEIEYVDKEETDKLINSVANEVRKIREIHPDKPIRFVAWSPNEGSGKWFYDQVMDSLQDIQTNSVSLIAPHNIMDRQELRINEPVYFYLDDAANSGQQIQQCITAFRHVVSDIKDSENHVEDEKRISENPVDLRIRLLRITDKVDNFINGQKKYLLNDLSDQLVIIDTKSNPNANKRMPTMDDLVAKLGLKEKQVQNPGAFFYGHHGRYPATLTTFRHKIQDNMPVALVEGRLSDRAPFLISRENRKSIRSLYH